MTNRTVTSVEVNSRFVPYLGYGSGMATQGASSGIVHVAYGHYNFAKTGETVSATLVLQMVALPDQARIVDLWVKVDFGGTGGFVVGDASLSNRFITGASLSAAPELIRYALAGNAATGNLPYKVSLTASDQNTFYPINLEIHGAPTASASGCVAMCVWYTIDVAAT